MRAGFDEVTGRMLVGWPHCQQSIRMCLRKRIRTVEMRYHHGCEVPELQDGNTDADTIFDVFVAIAEALADPDGGEPGFRLQTIGVHVVGRTGRTVFLLSGIFFPRGHLGDFSIYEPQDVYWPEAMAA